MTMEFPGSLDFLPDSLLPREDEFDLFRGDVAVVGWLEKGFPVEVRVGGSGGSGEIDSTLIGDVGAKVVEEILSVD